jgi:hypothetical protein
MVGTVLHENTRMLQLARELGFEILPLQPGDDAHEVRLELQTGPQAAPGEGPGAP